MGLTNAEGWGLMIPPPPSSPTNPPVRIQQGGKAVQDMEAGHF